MRCKLDIIFDVHQYPTWRRTTPANATPVDLLGHQWMSYYPLSVYTGTDTIIAASLCYLLYTNRTGYRRTDSLLNTLMLYTVNTGIITSICSLAAIIALKTSPHTFIVAAIEFLLTKIYVNSFLAMLNARNSLRDSGARMRRDYVLNTLQPTVTSEVTDESKPPELPQVLNIRNNTDSDSDGPRPYTDVEIDKPAARGYVPPAVSKGGIKEEVLESPSKQRASYPGPLLAPPQAHVYDTIHDTARSMPRHEKTLRESKDKADHWENSTSSNDLMYEV